MENPVVSVNFFRPSGKWYTEEKIDMSKYYDELSPKIALQKAIDEQTGMRFEGMIAVCIEPYHKHSFPVMVQNW